MSHISLPCRDNRVFLHRSFLFAHSLFIFSPFSPLYNLLCTPTVTQFRWVSPLSYNPLRSSIPLLNTITPSSCPSLSLVINRVWARKLPPFWLRFSSIWIDLAQNFPLEPLIHNLYSHVFFLALVSFSSSLSFICFRHLNNVYSYAFFLSQSSLVSSSSHDFLLLLSFTFFSISSVTFSVGDEIFSSSTFSVSLSFSTSSSSSPFLLLLLLVVS